MTRTFPPVSIKINSCLPKIFRHLLMRLLRDETYLFGIESKHWATPRISQNFPLFGNLIDKRNWWIRVSKYLQQMLNARPLNPHSLHILQDDGKRSQRCVTFDNTRVPFRATRRCQTVKSKFIFQSKINHKINNESRVCCNTSSMMAGEGEVEKSWNFRNFWICVNLKYCNLKFYLSGYVNLKIFGLPFYIMNSEFEHSFVQVECCPNFIISMTSNSIENLKYYEDAPQSYT